MSRPGSAAPAAAEPPASPSLSALAGPRRSSSLASQLAFSSQHGMHFANQLASKVSKRSGQAVALARKLVLSNRCPLCQADLKLKKRFCRRCGGVFCEACTEQRMRLEEYHSRFGVLRNRTAKMMHVCKTCFAAAAPSKQIAPSPVLSAHRKDVQAALPHHHLFPSHGEHPGDDRRGSITTRVQRVRASTLDRYMQSVAKAAKEPQSAPQPFASSPTQHQRKQSQSKDAQPLLQQQHKRATTLDGNFAPPSDPTQISLERAKELREIFFAGAAVAPPPAPVGDTSASVSAAANGAGVSATPLAANDANLPPAQRSWFDAFFSLFNPATVTDLELDQALAEDAASLEKMLAQSEASLVHSREALKESERQLEKSRLEQVRRVKAKLTDLQASRIASATEQGAKVKKQLQSHAALLKSEIAQGRAVVTLEDGQVIDLRNELSTTLGYLHELDVETVFPRCMQTKVRMAIPDDDGFVGVRDLDVEALDASFELELGPGAVAHVRVSGAVLNVLLTSLELRGSSAMLRVLAGLLPHTSMRICVTGSWDVSAVFDAGGTPDKPASQWVVRDASFNLQVTKGSAGMVPETLISYITSHILPGAVQTALLACLSGELGAFARLRENVLRCKGRLQVRGDVTPGVWLASFVGPTSASAHARRCAGLSDDEAAVVDFALRSPLAVAAGFPGGASSLSSLHQWRLQLAAVSVTQLGSLLSIVEAGAKVALPPGGLLSLIQRVDALAVKPVTLSLQLTDIAVDVDVGDGIALGIDTQLRWLEEDVGRHIRIETDLATAKEAASKVHRAFREVLTPLLRPSVHCNFGCMLAGGSGGLLALTLSDAQASLCLPSSWTLSALLWESPELYDGFVLVTKGKAGPGPGEYTLAFNVLPAGEQPDEGDEDDLELCVLGVRLDVFPPGTEPGSLRLQAQSVRSSLLLGSAVKLVEAAMLPPSPAAANPPPAGRERRASLANTNALADKSRRVLESLWGSFRITEEGIPVEGASSAWTGLLTKDESAFHLDLRGFHLGLERVGDDRVRLELSRARAARQDHSQATFTVRSSLQQLFASV